MLVLFVEKCTSEDEANNVLKKIASSYKVVMRAKGEFLAAGFADFQGDGDSWYVIGADPVDS